MKQIGVAFLLYAQDNDDRFPPWQEQSSYPTTEYTNGNGE
jgi:hypothetical protein